MDVYERLARLREQKKLDTLWQRHKTINVLGPVENRETSELVYSIWSKICQADAIADEVVSESSSESLLELKLEAHGRQVFGNRSMVLSLGGFRHQTHHLVQGLRALDVIGLVLDPDVMDVVVCTEDVKRFVGVQTEEHTFEFFSGIVSS